MASGTPGSPGGRGQVQVNTVMVIVFIKAMQVGPGLAEFLASVAGSDVSGVTCHRAAVPPVTWFDERQLRSVDRS